MLESEVRREAIVQCIETAASLRGAAEPFFARGEFLEPREWRGEEELAAGLHERREAAEEELRIGKAAEEICGEDDVEGFWILDFGFWIGKFDRVALLELHARAIDFFGNLREPGLGEIALDDFFVGMRALEAQSIRRGDERMGIVDAHDLTARARQLEGRAADGAAEVERAAFRAAGNEQLAHETGGKSDGLDWTGKSAKHLCGAAVVKQ